MTNHTTRPDQSRRIPAPNPEPGTGAATKSTQHTSDLSTSTSSPHLNTDLKTAVPDPSIEVHRPSLVAQSTRMKRRKATASRLPARPSVQGGNESGSGSVSPSGILVDRIEAAEEECPASRQEGIDLVVLK